MNDLLGDALRGKKKKETSSSTTSSRSNVPNSSRSSIRSKNKSNAKKKSACCFCNDSQPVISVQKSLTSKSYCLLHYYTTKACRIDVNKVHFIDNGEVDHDDEINTQLPFVQSIFSEAFSELQKDILTESTKAFKAISEKESDPLSILLEPTRSSNAHTAVGYGKEQKKKSKDGIVGEYEEEGGFLRHVQEKELSLIKQQSRRIASDAVASLQNHQEKNSSAGIYKRRKTSAKSSWHLVMSSTNPNKSWKPQQNLASGVKCPSCTSDRIEIEASITSSMNDVSKAQTWGAKRDNDISTRLRCLECNCFWFDEYL